MASELIFTKSGVLGDVPGRLRMVVTDTSGKDQRGLIAGLRCRYYSPDPTAQLAYSAQALTPLDAAGNATVDGLAAVSHTDLSADWTPVLSTLIAGVGHMDHRGSYNVWVRVWSTSTVPPRLRLVYDVGDLTLPEENRAGDIPGALNWYLLNLGAVRLDRAGSPHRWAGQIQAKGAAGGENVSVHRVWLVPTGEGHQKVSVPVDSSVGLASYVARDEFNQAAGNLAGKTAPVGGVWAGAGDADDFAVEATGKTAQRTAVSDVDISIGRFALAGVSTYTAVAVQADVKHNAVAAANNNDLRSGIIARYVDTNNWLMAVKFVDYITPGASKSFVKLLLGEGGTVREVASVEITGSSPVNAWKTIRLLVDATGRAHVWWFDRGASPGDPLISSGREPALATGGTLASGRVGIYDAWTGSQALTRNHDNFLAFVPTADAAIFANRSAELAWDGVTRMDAAGAAPGPLVPEGDLLRIPVSGPENRPVEFLVLASEGDLDRLPDSSEGTISARPFYRPTSLFATSA